MKITPFLERFLKENKKYSIIYSKSKYVGIFEDLFEFACEYVSFENKSVVDCGCGHSCLAKMIDKSKYIGIDISSYQIYKLKRRLPESKFIHCSLVCIPLLDKSCDISFCCDVLEHIHTEDVDDAIKEIIRVSDVSAFKISTREATYDYKKEGEDKLHLTVKEPLWWRNKLSLVGEIISEKIKKDNYYCIVKNNR